MASGFVIVTGSIGGGKSYYVVEQCIKALREGAQVFSNLAWRSEWLAQNGFLDQVHALPEDPNEWPAAIRGGREGAENVLAVDESTYLFHVWDQGTSKTKRRSLFEVFPMCRKVGLETYMIAQDASNIDVALRRQASQLVHCTNLRKLPGIAKFLAAYLGDFRRSFRAPKTGRELSAKCVRFDPNVADAYNTEDVTGVAQGIAREVTRRSGSVMSRPRWFWPAAIGVPVCCILWSWWSSQQALALAGIGNLVQPAKDRGRSEKRVDQVMPEIPPAVKTDWPSPQVVLGVQMQPLEYALAGMTSGRLGVRLRTREGVVFSAGHESELGRVTRIYKRGLGYMVEATEGIAFVRPLKALERIQATQHMVIANAQVDEARKRSMLQGLVGSSPGGSASVSTLPPNGDQPSVAPFASQP